MEEIKEFQIDPADIRTMQKDIARLQREGPQQMEEVLEVKKPETPSAIDEERKKEAFKEDVLGKAKQEKYRIDQEQKRKEEERKREGKQQIEKEVMEEKRAEEEKERIERREGERKEEQEEKQEQTRIEQRKIKEREKEREKEKEKEREQEQIRIEQRKAGEEERKKREWHLKKAEEERIKLLEAEKRSVQEIRKRAAEEAKREKKRLSSQLLKQQKAEIRKEIKNLKARKRPIELKRSNLFLEKQVLEKTLIPILNEERQIEEKINATEKREETAKSLRERQTIERTRWQMEEQRRKIEIRRWEKEKQKYEIDLAIKEINLNIKEILIEIKELKAKLTIIKKKENKVKLEKERIISQKTLEELIVKEIQPLQSEKNKLNENLNETEGRLKQISDRERTVEKEKQVLEEQERLIQNPEEKRDIEKQRWEKENERKKIECQRWGIEKEKEKIELSIKEIDLKLNYVLKKEERLKRKIDEINKFLSGIPEKAALKKIKPGTPPEVREPIPKKTEPEKIPEKKPEPAESFQPGLSIKEKLKGLREKRKVLEAEEQEKRLKKIDKIKERLLDIQEKEEKQRKDFLEKIKIQEKEGTPLKSPKLPEIGRSGKKEIIFRPLPEKLSVGEKLWVRLIILFVVLVSLAGIITFWYWYAVIRTVKKPAELEENVPFDEPLRIPTALIPIESLPIMEILSENEIPGLISQTINAEFQEKQILRILIKNKTQNAFTGLREFLTAFNVKSPETFYEKLNNDFTLFIDSEIIGNRLGFVALINDKESLADLMNSWESNIENDTSELFFVLGKQENALLPYFKTGWYQDVSFRCQPFSTQDLGICWSLFNENLILTTSWNTMEKVIDIINPVR